MNEKSTFRAPLIRFILLASFVCFSWQNYAQTVVDCSSSPVNDGFCYDSSEEFDLAYSASDPTLELTITFNAGTLEHDSFFGGTYDDLIIYDGTDNTGAVLYNSDDETTAVDLTGRSYTASSGSLFIAFDSDFSVSCVSGDQTAISYTVECSAAPLCTAPTIDSVTVVDSCNSDGTGTFSVEVVVSDAGDAGTVISDGTNTYPVMVGTVVAGPYNSGDTVSLTVDTLDDACDAILGDFTFTCPQPAPDNDDCANATAITCGETINATSVGSTGDQEGSGCTMGSNGIWFTFTGTGADMIVSVDASFDHEVAISTGVCGDLTNINCDDQSLGTETHTFESVLDATYYVYVAHYSSSSTTTGTVDITLECAEIPECTAPTIDSATVVDSCNSDGTGTFSVEVVVSDAGDAGTVISDGTNTYPVMVGTVVAGPYNSGDTVSLTVDTTDDACDASFGDFSFTCPEPAPANDDCAGALPLDCGVTVTGSTEGATASGLDAECNGFASSDAQDLFYTFVADGTSSYTLSLDDASGGFSFDGVMFVYSGPCDDLTSLACSDSGSPEEITLDAPSAGTYTVRIFDYSGTADFTLDLTCVAPPECVEPTIDSVTVVDSCNSDGTGTFNVEVVVSDAGDAGTVISDGTNTYPVVVGTVTAGPYNSGDTVSLTVDATDDACDASLGDFSFTCPEPAPANDDCAGALPLDCGVTVTGSTEGATASGLDAECNGFASSDAQDLFYTFVADGTSSYTLSLDDASGGFSFDGVMFVYSGPCDDLTSLACSDSGSPEEITLDALSAGTYTVRIFDYSGTADFTLDLTCVAPQVCEVEVVSTLAEGQQFYTVCEGSQDSFELEAVINSNGNVSVQWQSIPSDFSTSWVNIPGATETTLTITDISLPDNYYYRVVAISDNLTPDNTSDDCSAVSGVAATISIQALPTVTFTAPADIEISAGVQTGLGGGSPTGGVYSGVGVTDDGNGMTYNFDPAVAGVGTTTITYSYTDSNGCSALAEDDVEVIEPSGPSNDDCAGALPLDCGITVTGSTEGATASGLDAECNGFASSDAQDLFYTFVADGTSSYTLSLDDASGGFSFDGVMFVYSGPCDDLTSLACSDSGSPEEITLDAPSAGTYTVRIFDYFGTADFTLDLTCVAPPECVEPTIDSVTVVDSCNSDGTGTFNVEVVVSDAGDAGTVISDGTNTYPVMVGTVVAGPYNSGDTVSLTVDATDDACDASLGDFSFTCPEPAPANDDCAGALPLDCGVTVTGSTEGATASGLDAECNGFASSDAQDLFYTFVADGTSSYTLSLDDASGGFSFDGVMFVYSGPCDDLTSLACSDSGSPEEITLDAPSAGTYTVRIFDYFGTADFTLDLTCETPDPCAGQLPQLTWTGTMDSNWENTGNWDNNEAPGLIVFADVTIPMGTPNYPMLTVGQNLYISECSTVTVESGASLNVSPNVEVTNDGIVANDGTVTFESDATGSAYIGSGMGMFMGDFTVERYIPAKRAYRQLGTPVTTNTPISDNWQQDTHITGPAGNTDGFDVTFTGNPSAYIFDNIAYEYVELANTNATNLIPGTMYHILIRGDRNTDLGDNDATPSETTLHATGELTAENIGSQMIAVNVPEQRFIAVGNPFQSQIDMNTVLTTGSTNINPNFYWVWDPTLGARGAYTAIMTSSGIASTSGSDANQYLQAGQAGWVYTSGAGQSSVIFDQTSKNNSGFETSTFTDNGGSTSLSQLRLSLYESSAFANNDTATDGVLILFGANGNNGIDANDALSITNLDENFATNNNGELLSIENRAMPQETEVIQLEINTYRSTNYTIVAEGISIEGVTPYLFDNYTGTYTEIPQTGSVNYSYSVDAGITSSIANDRFTVVFYQSTLSAGSFDLDSVKLYPNPTNIGKFYLNVPLGMDDLEITIYDVLGTRLYNETGFNAGSTITVKAGSEFSMGTYFVELSSKGRTTTKKLIIN